MGIGAKRGGTQEQCSQKLFELAEIFRKVIQIIINQSYILCKFKKKHDIKLNFSIFRIFSGLFPLISDFEKTES